MLDGNYYLMLGCFGEESVGSDSLNLFVSIRQIDWKILEGREQERVRFQKINSAGLAFQINDFLYIQNFLTRN